MQISTSTSIISVTPEGFLEVKFIDNDLKIDLEEAKAQHNASLQLVDGKQMLILVDARDSMHDLTKEAKEYIAQVSGKKAEAIVVKELHQRIIATFYLKVTVSHYNHPVKVFNDRDEAVKWLLSIK
ncbi:MAG: STAS/SEC14 domain-containing protein [Sphingobacteriaceae bacterium]|nr:STAS/SEC14 domain-containing protein [Sphingobacteriaceae bacterium]MBK7818923.1 STAS/SEC14 domain-containing protein [Sphingobacteriaceae bacterium]